MQFEFSYWEAQCSIELQSLLNELLCIMQFINFISYIYWFEEIYFSIYSH